MLFLEKKIKDIFFRKAIFVLLKKDINMHCQKGHFFQESYILIKSNIDY